MTMVPMFSRATRDNKKHKRQ